ncbi:MAG: protease modulator HflC [Planctomycetota bacterium]
MKFDKRALGVIAALLAITLFSSTYVVNEWEQVVITQFGEPKGEPKREAGLYFRLPFVQDVNRFDRRVLIWDGKKNEITTADKRFIWVDTTARWRIADPLKFLQTVRTEIGAQGRLDGILDSATRDVISAHDLIEVVRLSNRVLSIEPDADDVGQLDDRARDKIANGREKLVGQIKDQASVLAPQYGIELIDVRIKRINYVEQVRRAVYKRMISERQRIAERYRSIGEGKKAEIEGRRERDEKRITSEAYRKAQEIVAKADAEAAQIFADSYGADPEFYSFYRTLEAYKKIVGANHTLVVSPDSPLYRYLSSESR